MKTLTIRPYARLLTMLGEQLIKNERIALIELIKNSYDADADWVKISFCNFGENFSINSNSKIIIEDSGLGMSEETIIKHWLNPATPEKMNRKKIKPTTPKGRIIQGEKGIGRFAILKLGRTIRVISRAKGESNEHILMYDLSKYDDEFLTEDGKEKELFIEDIAISFESRPPLCFIPRDINHGIRKIVTPPHGTRIEISDLKGSWSNKKIESVYRDVNRLQSIFVDKDVLKENKNDFNVLIYKDKELLKLHEKYLEELDFLLKEKSVLRIENGIYNEEKKQFEFLLNGQHTILKLSSPEITGLKVFRDYFQIREGKNVETECGPFRFGFFVFDFSAQAQPKFQLDKKDKETIRDHRIYLYRDGIRVYPYGEPDDDWLNIDIYRGTISAGHFLSNDQVVGYVKISQKDNPRLKDKTNREGLIEEGNATDDFISLLKVLLAYIRQKPYAKYRLELTNKKEHDIFRKGQVEKEFNLIKQAVTNQPQIRSLVAKAEMEYKAERSYLVRRAETTEELAGVGLSVETASHDIMAIMSKTVSLLDNLIKDTLITEGKLDIDALQQELQALRGMITFIESQLKDIQLLFRSTKQRRRSIKILEIVEKVERIYRRLLKKENISLTIDVIGPPLVAKTTDAVLLQLLLNLFDNAVYWLQQVSSNNKTIIIVLDGENAQLVFADNGPGISKGDIPYIFEPFYSGKGEEGRGLGLYIARQLLERNDYSIELAEFTSEKVLPGANFLISFIPEEK